MSNFDDFEEIERGKQRMAIMGYTVGQIPMSSEHAAWINNEKKKGNKEIGKLDEEQTRIQGEAGPERLRGPKIHVYVVGNTVHGESPWVRRVEFWHQETHQHFEANILLDTGCTGDWISNRLVQQLRLPVKEDNGDVYSPINGASFSSMGLVRLSWALNSGHQYLATDFHILRASPYDIIIGWETLIKLGLVDGSSGGKPIGVIVSVKPNRATMDDMDRNRVIAEEQSNLRDWHREMQLKGYRWDAAKQVYVGDGLYVDNLPDPPPRARELPPGAVQLKEISEFPGYRGKLESQQESGGGKKLFRLGWK
ncbi:MAG: hypothetical protein Q9227_003808 [Pyrenula ochraceoflavens]